MKFNLIHYKWLISIELVKLNQSEIKKHKDKKARIKDIRLKKTLKFVKFGPYVTRKTAYKNFYEIKYYPGMHNKRKARKQRKRNIRCLA